MRLNPVLIPQMCRRNLEPQTTPRRHNFNPSAEPWTRARHPETLFLMFVLDSPFKVQSLPGHHCIPKLVSMKPATGTSGKTKAQQSLRTFPKVFQARRFSETCFNGTFTSLSTSTCTWHVPFPSCLYRQTAFSGCPQLSNSDGKTCLLRNCQLPTLLKLLKCVRPSSLEITLWKDSMVYITTTPSSLCDV